MEECEKVPEKEDEKEKEKKRKKMVKKCEALGKTFQFSCYWFEYSGPSLFFFIN